MNRIVRILLGLMVTTLIAPGAARSLGLLYYNFDDAHQPTLNAGTLGPTYNGLLEGHTTFVPRGGGYAASFDGVQDFVRPLGDPSAFYFGTADFSLRAVIRTASSEPGQDSRRFIAMFENTGLQPKFALGVHRSTGQVTFGLADGVSGVEVRSSFAVNDDKEHSVLAVRHGSELKLWVDGVYTNESIPGGFGSINPGGGVHFRIGGRHIGNNTDDFIGTIDDFEIHDQALTAVPEPGTTVLLAPAALMLSGIAIRRSVRRGSNGKCEGTTRG